MAKKIPADGGSKLLAGRRILITGGSSGIGLACAELFLREGARVAVFDVQECPISDCAFVKGDVTDEASVRAAVASAADRLGGLDGLVNGVGIAGFDTVAETKLSSWRKLLDVNLTGAFMVTQAALPILQLAEDASIVNICSGIALRPSAGQAAYSASKAGLLAFTRALAQEVGPKIRVNATCPGATDTPFAGGADLAQLGKMYTLGRVGTPQEQAEAILFLISSRAAFITGVALAVDGGRTFH